MSAMTTTLGAALTDPDRKGPGRPRSARVDEAIIDAVIELLSEGVTAEALSIEAVATRAGVGKATIYRRWVNKDALLVDAVGALKGPLPEIGGMSVREDLVALLRPVGRKAAHSAAVLPCLISELKRSPKLNEVYQKIIEPRRELMRSVLRRGIDAGELRGRHGPRGRDGDAGRPAGGAVGGGLESPPRPRNAAGAAGRRGLARDRRLGFDLPHDG
jgi:AcrR family transcriptional regulator